MNESKAGLTEAGELRQVTKLLGGSQTLKKRLRTSLDAHEMLLGGLPAQALNHLVGNLVVLRVDESLARAVGMSLRTYQRHKVKPLNQEQSGRTWKFAEILSKATIVLGSQEEAEQWLERPAMGLNQHRPIDLLATPAGVELVEDFLERLTYGVYV
jgi:putative toxin-antitoxin system antitoxin component (TIGR02293 family)